MASAEARRVFAIVRFDAFQPESVAIENRIKVVQIMDDESAAKAEASRLNETNRGKECAYFVQPTRLR